MADDERDQGLFGKLKDAITGAGDRGGDRDRYRDDDRDRDRYRDDDRDRYRDDDRDRHRDDD